MNLPYGTVVEYKIKDKTGRAMVVGLTTIDNAPEEDDFYLLLDLSLNFPNNEYRYSTFGCYQSMFRVLL